MYAQKHWSVQRKQLPCISRQTLLVSLKKAAPLHLAHCWSVLRKQFPSISLTKILMVSPLASRTHTHTHTAGQSPGIAHTHCWSVLTKSSSPCISHTHTLLVSLDKKQSPLHLTHRQCWSVPTKSSPFASRTQMLVSLKQAVPLQSGWSAGRASDPGRWSGMASPC